MRPGQYVRHRNTGMVYVILGFVEIKSAHPELDDAMGVLYMEHSGGPRRFVRTVTEFSDGRFEIVERP